MDNIELINAYRMNELSHDKCAGIDKLINLNNSVQIDKYTNSILDEWMHGMNTWMDGLDRWMKGRNERVSFHLLVYHIQLV